MRICLQNGGHFVSASMCSCYIWIKESKQMVIMINKSWPITDWAIAMQNQEHKATEKYEFTCNKIRMQNLYSLFHQSPGMHTFHDDVRTRKRFPHYWSFVKGIHQLPVDSPHKKALMFTLMSALTVEQTVELSVIWDAMILIWCHCDIWDWSEILCYLKGTSNYQEVRL